MWAFYSTHPVKLRVESGRSLWTDSGFCLLIGWRGSMRRHLARGGRGGSRSGYCCCGRGAAAARGGGGEGQGRGPKKSLKAGSSGAGTSSGMSGAVKFGGFLCGLHETVTPHGSIFINDLVGICWESF